MTLHIGDVLWITTLVPQQPAQDGEYPLRVTGFAGQHPDTRVYVNGVRMHTDTSSDMAQVQVLVAVDHTRAVRRWCPPELGIVRLLPGQDASPTPPARPPVGYLRVGRRTRAGRP